jgi:hypothetical protein
MQSFCAIMTATSLLLHAAFGGCQCWHASVSEPFAFTSVESCCPDCNPEQGPAEAPQPCEGCALCSAVCAYLPTVKATVDGPTSTVALQRLTSPRRDGVRESSGNHNLAIDDQPASHPPLHLLHQVFLI